jgi:hypothetical protein
MMQLFLEVCTTVVSWHGMAWHATELPPRPPWHGMAYAIICLSVCLSVCMYVCPCVDIQTVAVGSILIGDSAVSDTVDMVNSK